MEPSQLQSTILVRVVFNLVPHGTLEREWTWRELDDGDVPSGLLRGPPPGWLQNPRRHWDHPQDPITLTGTVLPEHEAEAREALGL